MYPVPRKNPAPVAKLIAQGVPLTLTVAALGWFIIHPGYGTFFLAAAAFLLWGSVTVAMLVLGKLAGGARRIEQMLSADGEWSGAGDGMPALVRDSGKLRELWERLRAIERGNDLRLPARKTLGQLRSAAELLMRFEQLLGEKLVPGELTYDRFMGSARQGFDLIIREIEEALRCLENIRSMGGGAPRSHGQAQPEALRQLQDQQLTRVVAILSANEQAIGQMAQVNVSVSEMKGASGRSATDLQAAIDELRELAARARKL